jgi:hypothetical protein
MRADQLVPGSGDEAADRPRGGAGRPDDESADPSRGGPPELRRKGPTEASGEVAAGPADALAALRRAAGEATPAPPGAAPPPRLRLAASGGVALPAAPPDSVPGASAAGQPPDAAATLELLGFTPDAAAGLATHPPAEPPGLPSLERQAEPLRRQAEALAEAAPTRPARKRPRRPAPELTGAEAQARDLLRRLLEP